LVDPRGGMHPLMVPLLLAMTGNNTDIDKQLAELANFIQSTQAAVQSLRSGMETFHAGLNKISRPPAPSPAKPDSGQNAKSDTNEGGFSPDTKFSGPNDKVTFTDKAGTN